MSASCGAYLGFGRASGGACCWAGGGGGAWSACGWWRSLVLLLGLILALLIGLLLGLIRLLLLLRILLGSRTNAEAQTERKCARAARYPNRSRNNIMTMATRHGHYSCNSSPKFRCWASFQIIRCVSPRAKMYLLHNRGLGAATPRTPLALIRKTRAHRKKFLMSDWPLPSHVVSGHVTSGRRCPSTG